MRYAFLIVLLTMVPAERVHAQMTAEQEYRCLSLLAVMPAMLHPDLQKIARPNPRPQEIVAKLEQLAREGDGEAQVAMALLSQSAYCFPQDTAAARTWMQRAAEGGNLQAQHRLGLVYLTGPETVTVTMRLDLPQDTALGLRWLTKAAEAGYSDSAWVLAQRYERGLPPLPKDEKLAYLWYSVAKATNRAAAVASTMEASDLEAAKKLLAKWLQDHPQTAR